jgi:hypothetical protein
MAMKGEATIDLQRVHPGSYLRARTTWNSTEPTEIAHGVEPEANRRKSNFPTPYHGNVGIANDAASPPSPLRYSARSLLTQSQRCTEPPSAESMDRRGGR